MILPIVNKRRWLYILGFLTLPLAFLLFYTLICLSTVLKNGFLSEPYFLGTPLFITLHTLIAFASLVWLWRNLYLLRV